VTDERIDPKVIKAASEAYRRARDQLEYFGATEYDGPSPIEAAIRAADRERGLKEERKVRRAFVGPDDIEYPDELRVRLTSDWRPVERPS
jgi:hypothetical protein